ncbi:CCA tRNA nucleotidyltransferase [Bacillus coahuilensis]|nr:CCA tRNA nucleotidyltransferase [Bacillus coahuilensis]
MKSYIIPCLKVSRLRMTLPRLFNKALPVLNEIEKCGFEAVFVGGSVRDFLLGRPINDVDIATSAFPHEVKELFPHTIDLGIEHGTVLVLYNGEPYEITTYRSEEGYNDYRHPKEVRFIRSLEQDLMRRDFTMNAIAMNREGRLFDPFDGEKDITREMIRTVGNPSERLTEDALRIMRAVRFQSQLGFKLEQQTERALKEFSHLLPHVSIERLLVEFDKLLAGPFISIAINTLIEQSIYQHLFDLEDQKSELEKFKNYVSSSSELTFDERWLLFIKLINKEDIHVFLTSLRLPNNRIKQLIKDLHFLDYSLQMKLTPYDYYQMGKERMLRVEKVRSVLTQSTVNIAEIIEVYDSLPIKERAELCLNGNDLMNWTGRQPGPWLKGMIEEIEEEIAHRNLVNQKEMVKEWVTRWNPPSNPR